MVQRAPLDKIAWALILISMLAAVSWIVPFDLSIEVLLIVVSFTIFAMVWNTRKFLSNNYILFIGIAFLFIALLDFLRLSAILTDSEHTGLLWGLTRLLQAATFFAAAFFIGRGLRVRAVMAVYAILTLIILYLTYSGLLELAGIRLLTGILICLFYTGALYMLYIKRSKFDKACYFLIAGAIMAAIVSSCFYVAELKTASRMFDGLEFIILYFAIVETSLKRPYRTLFRSLYDSHRLKELFVDIMGHDMLNPAGAVKIRAQIALGKEHNKEQEEHFRFILRESEKLVNMIENAKKLAKLEDTAELEKKSIDLKRYMEAVIKSLEEKSSKKKQKIVLQAKGKFTAQANELIYDVYENLLSNAIKYSPRKSTIKVVMKKRNSWIETFFYDEGEGIPDKYKSIIFTRFSRLEKKHIKGSGLGLAIVKKVVEAHNGSVWIKDNPKGGSIFIVSLPA
ncbi:MAG: MASE3 domain-containing protein [Candidatus Nanoarchaeia archaeon]